MSDESVSSMHADLVARLEQDKRLRVVEQAVASQDSTLKAMHAEGTADRFEQREAMRAMETRLMGAIEGTKPQTWPAVSGVVAAIALLLLIAQQIYGR